MNDDVLFKEKDEIIRRILSTTLDQGVELSDNVKDFIETIISSNSYAFLTMRMIEKTMNEVFYSTSDVTDFVLNAGLCYVMDRSLYPQPYAKLEKSLVIAFSTFIFNSENPDTLVPKDMASQIVTSRSDVENVFEANPWYIVLTLLSIYGRNYLSSHLETETKEK